MIDYYLKKHCALEKDKINIRCNGCVWLDKNIKKCIFAIDYPKQVTIKNFGKRIKNVNKKQQEKISGPFRRFVIDEPRN